MLVRRVNLVVRLGDSYRKNPKDTRSYLAALAVDVEKRNAAAEKEWKERIENDPEAADELDSAARDYAEENGYDYEELTSPEARTRVTIVVNPYPYWFGYPYWYSDAYLYPYGYWYPYRPYFGYYHYHKDYVWWGVPPWPFVHWFYWGHHHHHYAHLHHNFHGHFANHHDLPEPPLHSREQLHRAQRPGRGPPRRTGRSGRGGRSTGRQHGERAVGSASNSGADRGYLLQSQSIAQEVAAGRSPHRAGASAVSRLTTARPVGRVGFGRDPSVRSGRRGPRISARRA